MTVMAALRPTQKARERSSWAISEPTVRMRRGPKSARPREMPTAPITSTQRGMPAVPSSSSPVLVRASTTPASGPTAFATSLAPCAKDSSAAPATSGMVKRELTPSRDCRSDGDRRAIRGRLSVKVRTPATRPRANARGVLTSTTFCTPLRAR